jgi:hypothetical protein
MDTGAPSERPSTPPITSNTKPRPPPAPFDAETYFSTQPKPPTLDADIAGAKAWVERQASELIR